MTDVTTLDAPELHGAPIIEAPVMRGPVGRLDRQIL